MPTPLHVSTGSGVGTLAPRKLSLFTLLDHFRGSFTAPQALGPLDPRFVLKGPLQDRVDKLVKDQPDFARLGFAICDMTGKTRAYAGHRDTEAFYPASIGKLAVMLGAYQLRFDLGVLAATEKLYDHADLYAAARERWGQAQVPAPGAKRDEVRAASPKIVYHDHVVRIDGKPVPLGGFAGPDLERIFDPTVALTAAAPAPTFTSTGEGYHHLYFHDYFGKFPALFEGLTKSTIAALKLRRLDLGTLGFAQRLALMIGFSDNASTATIVKDLGFLCIDSPLLRNGLYDLASGGMWCGTTYGGTTWRLDPINAQSQGATPRALVTAFTSIFDELLVDPDSCKAMQRLTHKQPMGGPRFGDDPSFFKDWAPGAGTRSFVKGAFYFTDPKTDVTRFWLGKTAALKVHSKLGIYQGTSDVAHVEHTLKDGRTLRYAVSVLGVPAAHGIWLENLVLELDRFVDALHP